MKSSQEFDEELLKNSHFEIHREMLPFIGSRFKDSKVLIIAESHYVPLNTEIIGSEEWYYTNDVNSLHKKTQCNTFTREIFEKIFDKSQKPHRIFINLQSALSKLDTPKDMDEIGWYNYFQIPAFHKNSVNPNSLDHKIAKETFEHILSTIQPGVVIFTSVKAFKAISTDLICQKDSHIYIHRDFNTIIDFVAHPNSIWWYRKSMRYFDEINKVKRSGLQKFIDVLNQSKR